MPDAPLSLSEREETVTAQHSLTAPQRRLERARGRVGLPHRDRCETM